MIDWCSTQPDDGQICLWILVQIDDLYRETGDAKYRDFLLEKGQMLMDIGRSTDPEVIDQRNSTMMLGIEARELAAIYQINKDQSYIDEATARINAAYEGGTPDNYVVYNFNDNPFKYNSCWPELANMEIYAATSDDSNLAQALDLLDTYDPAGNVLYMGFLTNIEPCGELYLKAYEATGDDKYRQGAEKIVRHILEHRWDTAENNLVSGSGTVLRDDMSKVDTLTDVAYLVRILSALKDSEVLA